ncbi:hypothetical protein I317_01424 [Kwoniella heveanensis CBS 569]|nr:hypothetical protein I317_01424 [Kwoniella heveanensis CBS 569]
MSAHIDNSSSILERTLAAFDELPVMGRELAKAQGTARGPQISMYVKGEDDWRKHYEDEREFKKELLGDMFITSVWEQCHRATGARFTKRTGSDAGATKVSDAARQPGLELFIPEGTLLADRSIEPSEFHKRFQDTLKTKTIKSGATGASVQTPSGRMLDASLTLKDALSEDNHSLDVAKSTFIDNNIGRPVEEVMSTWGTLNSAYIQPRFRPDLPDPSLPVNVPPEELTSAQSFHVDYSISPGDIMKSHSEVRARLEEEIAKAEKRVKMNPSVLSSSHPSFHADRDTPEQRTTRIARKTAMANSIQMKRTAMRSAISSALTGIEAEAASAVDLSEAFIDNTSQSDISVDPRGIYLRFFKPSHPFSVPVTLDDALQCASTGGSAIATGGANTTQPPTTNMGSDTLFTEMASLGLE